MSDPIVDAFREHHTKVFKEFGATPRGLDWSSEDDLQLRYEKMLSVIEHRGGHVSVLDVGCGYGGLLAFATGQGLRIRYTGIDIVEQMVDYAATQHPNARFLHGDVLTYEFAESFDYVICSGVLTQKLGAGRREMARFAQEMIRRLYSLCERGVAFNVMSSNVNYMVPNLFYTSPVEMLAFCLGEITNHVRLDHAYRLFYEYSVYLYRQSSSSDYGP